MDATAAGGARFPLRVLAIAGSLRRGSYNRRLLEAAAEGAPAGLAIRLSADLGALPHFNEDLELPAHGAPEPVRSLREAVAAADGLLIATPEYNWSIPGVLKNAIDWLSRASQDQVLAGKPVAIVGASTGSWGTRQAQSVLRHTLAATESCVMPAPTLFVRNADRLFGADGALVDPATKRALAALLFRFTAWIGATAPPARLEPGSSSAVEATPS